MAMIRPAIKEDIPQMLAIYAPYVEHTTVSFEYTPPSEEEFTRRFETITAQFPWLVWEEAGRVTGYAYASAPFTRAAYRWCAEPSVYLLPQAQGRGIGTRLYRALEKILSAQGYQVVYALISGNNEKSLHFHAKNGYKQVGFLPDCGYKFEQWIGLCWLEKRLGFVENPSMPPAPWSEIIDNNQKLDDFLM